MYSCPALRIAWPRAGGSCTVPPLGSARSGGSCQPGLRPRTLLAAGRANPPPSPWKACGSWTSRPCGLVPTSLSLLADLGAEVIRVENPSVFPPSTKGYVPRPSPDMELGPLLDMYAPRRDGDSDRPSTGTAGTTRSPGTSSRAHWTRVAPRPSSF